MPSPTSAFGEQHGSYTSAFDDSSSSDGYGSPFSNRNITWSYYSMATPGALGDILITAY